MSYTYTTVKSSSITVGVDSEKALAAADIVDVANNVEARATLDTGIAFPSAVLLRRAFLFDSEFTSLSAFIIRLSQTLARRHCYIMLLLVAMQFQAFSRRR